MTDKIILGNIASFQNDSTAVAQYNANNALITAAFDNTLSRDGTSPNQMNSSFDLNGNAILNGGIAGIIAANVGFTPTGNVASTNVQTAIAEVDTEKAAISSLSNIAFSGASPDFSTVGVSWTPVLTCATPGDLAVTYNTRIGRYYQLSSNLILLFASVVTTSFTYTTASGNVQITGFPFTQQNTAGFNPRGGLTFTGITKAGYTQFVGAMAPNTSIILFSGSGSGQTTATVAITDLPSGGVVQLTTEMIMFI